MLLTADQELESCGSGDASYVPPGFSRPYFLYLINFECAAEYKVHEQTIVLQAVWE